MEGVNHVHIVEVSCCSLVCNVHRMLQRQTPHRESFKLGITCMNAALVLAIKLTQTDSHLTRTRTWSRNNHQRTLRLYIVILAKALITGNQLHIVRITFNEVMVVGLDAQTLQPVAELVGSTLPVVVGNHYRTNHEATVHKLLAQTKHILIVGNAEVGTHLVLLNVFGTDDDDNLNAVAQLRKHAQLAVWLKARQHTAGMVVVEEFAAKLQVKLAIELGDALTDVFRLNLQILLVVKS